MSFLRGQVLSGHAPCPAGTFLPNLGSRNRENLEKSFNVIRESAVTTAYFEGEILVLHAGYTMDDLVYRDYRLRQATLDALPDELGDVWLKEGAVCRGDYTTDETIQGVSLQYYKESGEGKGNMSKRKE